MTTERKPYPFQQIGIDWLLHAQRAMLGDEMGLGKTVTALCAAKAVAGRVGGLTRVVVVCPAVARDVWRQHAADWWPDGPDGAGLQLRVVSYAALSRNLKLRNALGQWLRGDDAMPVKAGIVILDEAHALKSPGSQRTKAVYGQYARREGLCLANARPDLRVWPLSGTFMPNNVTELFPHLRALFPELITPFGRDKPMNEAEFRTTYADVDQTPWGVRVRGTRKEMAAILRLLLTRAVLRRTVTSVGLELPPLIWANPIVIEPAPWQVPLMQELDVAELELRERVANAKGEDAVRELFTAAEPVAIATVQRILSAIKAPVVAEQVRRELEEGQYQKVVVFVRHTDAAMELAATLADFSPVVIRGGQTDARRTELVAAFQTDPQTRVAVVMQQTANTALTLTAADQVVFAEFSWVPADNLQAAKRCHRIGQNRPVMVRSFTVKGSTDEMVARAVARKMVGLNRLDMTDDTDATSFFTTEPKEKIA